jgi:hypothetical protein
VPDDDQEVLAELRDVIIQMEGPDREPPRDAQV